MFVYEKAIERCEGRGLMGREIASLLSFLIEKKRICAMVEQSDPIVSVQ